MQGDEIVTSAEQVRALIREENQRARAEETQPAPAPPPAAEPRTASEIHANRARIDAERDRQRARDADLERARFALRDELPPEVLDAPELEDEILIRAGLKERDKTEMEEAAEFARRDPAGYAHQDAVAYLRHRWDNMHPADRRGYALDAGVSDSELTEIETEKMAARADQDAAARRSH